jgi:hypothetical protein
MGYHFRIKKYSKFHAKPTIVDGVRFASKREAARYQDLKLAEQAGSITDLKLQPRFEFPIGFRYTADFRYMQNGKEVIEDVKGMMTRDATLRIKCFRYFYPALELRIIK